jgi:hypothetical protein
MTLNKEKKQSYLDRISKLKQFCPGPGKYDTEKAERLLTNGLNRSYR